MIGQSLSISRHHHTNAVTPEWIAHRARQAIATVAMSRATWQRHHVLAEAQRIVRSTGHAADDTLAQRITAAALTEPISLPLARIDDGEMGEPAALRRRDGASVYTRTGIALYTSAEISPRSVASCTPRPARRPKCHRHRCRHRARRLRSPRQEPQPWPGCPGHRNGHRRPPCRACARAGRRRKDHRHGRAVARLAQLRRHRARPGSDRGGLDQSRRGPERPHRHPRQVHPPHRQPVQIGDPAMVLRRRLLHAAHRRRGRKSRNPAIGRGYQRCVGQGRHRAPGRRRRTDRIHLRRRRPARHRRRNRRPDPVATRAIHRARRRRSLAGATCRRPVGHRLLHRPRASACRR